MHPPIRTPREVFAAAVRLSPEEWDTYLDETCAGDEDLRRRVRDLLEAHREAGSFMALSAAGEVTAPARGTEEGPGTVIGTYRLLQQIGEGGMGSVYLAEQTEPVRRQVALKVIKPGMGSRQVVARFEAERQALALMDHPHIARVLDAGTTASGQPFFVMELVKGMAITQFCDDRRLTPRQRLELFVLVCQAVQHAHQKGIIHRDIRPSNVLVTLYDGKPIPKVIDFGIAKAMGEKLTEQTFCTASGGLLGTPTYMSPEQTKLDQLDIDTRSDIYSLGVLLYELLTGTTPIPRERVNRNNIVEVLRLIREEEPPRPSTRLGTTEKLPSIAANRSLEPKQLSRLVRGELDWIVMKCLEKDRNRRYETANGLARDVERYLHDEPVQACPPSVGYRLRKFARRNKGPMLAASLVLLALVGGIVGTTWQAVRATAARDAAAIQEQLATDRAEDLERSLYFQRIARVDLELASANVGRAAQILDACSSKHRHWEWRYLKRLCNAELFALTGHTASVQCVVFSPDGRFLASAGLDQTVRLWDIATGQEVRVLRCDQLRVNSVAFSPDGRLLAAVSGYWLDGQPGNLKLWDTATGNERFTTTPHRSTISGVAFTPDGRRLVTSGWDGKVCIHDVATGKVLNVLTSQASTLKCVAVSPDGKLIAAGSHDRLIVLWGAASGAEVRVLSGHTADVLSVAFSPDSRELVSSGWDSVVNLWNVATGEVIRSFTEHTLIVQQATFSPDGQRIASASRDGTVRVWSRKGGPALLVIAAHSREATSVAFSPGGSCLATAGWDQVVKVWDANKAQSSRLLRARSGRLRRIRHFTVSPDGSLYAAACDNPATHPDPGRVTVFDPAMHRPPRDFGECVGGVRCVAFSPDSRSLAADCGHVVKLWDPRAGKELAVLEGHTAPISCLAFSPDGRRLASASQDATILLWDLTAAKPAVVATLRGHEGPVRWVAFRRDGRLVASGGDDGKVRTWDVDTGQPVGAFAHHKGPVNCVVFDPAEGARLASASEDGTTRVWEADTGRESFVLRGHVGPVRSVAFSHDGLRLATCGADGSICVWDAATGQEALTLRRQMLEATAVAFSPDGRSLAASGPRSAPPTWGILLWEAGTNTGDGNRLSAWHTLEAEALEARGQWRSALVHRNALVEANPNDPSAWSLRGWCYRRLANWDRAIADYSRAIELKPDDPILWGTRAGCHEHRGQWEQGIIDYSQGIDLKSDYWEAWIGRARCHVRLNQWDQAIVDFAGLVRLQPDEVVHWHLLASAHLAAGDVEGHRRVCRDMLGRFGRTTNPGIASRMLYACVRVPDVADDLSQLVALGKLASPDFKGNERILGAAYYRAGRFTEALRAFEQSAARSYPRRAWDWCFLALCHHRLGHADEARLCLHKADQWIKEADRLQKDKRRGSATPWVDWFERVEVLELRREAEGLLKGTDR